MLPTPIASFRLLSTQPATAAALRRSALVHQLVQSMQAPVLEAQEASERDDAHSGVGVIARGPGCIAQVAGAAAQGRRWLLCVAPQAQLPGRMLIHCDSDAARSETLRLVASVMRHLHAEATFVSVQSPAAPRTEATSAFRALLDARAELQQTHGLDIRTEVYLGNLAGWATQLAASTEPVLVVLGLDGTPAELERNLNAHLSALFEQPSQCTVLLSCTGGPARARAGAETLAPAFGAAEAVPGLSA